MSRKTFLVILNTLLALEGILISFLGAESFQTFLALNEPQKTIAKIVAIILGCLIVIIAAWLLVQTPGKKVRSWNSRRTTLTCYDCNEHDIRKIAAIAAGEFGDLSTSEDQTLRLHALDPEMFTSVKDSDGTIHGYFCLIKLTKAGYEAVLRNDFHLSPPVHEYIYKGTKNKYHPVYIGAVYGRRNDSKSFALGTMMNELRKAQPRFVAARAATEDGLRVLTKYEFSPVPGAARAVGELFFRKGAPSSKI